MSVIVKGMEMPENCCQCEWHEYYVGGVDWCHACRKTGTMPIDNAELGRAKDCPLFEIPSKHGRLIDADELMNESRKDGAYGYVDTKQIYDAHTVIEAEGE